MESSADSDQMASSLSGFSQTRVNNNTVVFIHCAVGWARSGSLGRALD